MLWRNDDIGQAALALPRGDSELVLTTQHPCEANWLVDDVPQAVRLFEDGELSPVASAHSTPAACRSNCVR